ncbi:hypothetical protein AQUSIP_08070 [Aquicella siphonis]|uniref:Uncharacterized protein n=1 Tax=Aquicella siphonis TaxID=254247 RepID=A0A5E4PGE0_9COXI|nr:hypothetical protein [Aquicella siphonis]VVC75517.1 hypothetical protein AQUSIP_08070 [Aquicella siphonis]
MLSDRKNEDPVRTGSVLPLLYAMKSVFIDFTHREIILVNQLIKEACPRDFNGFLKSMKTQLYSGCLGGLRFHHIPDIIKYVKLMSQLDYLLKYHITSAWNAAQTEIQSRTRGSVKIKPVTADDALPILITVILKCTEKIRESGTNIDPAALTEKIGKLCDLNNFIYGSNGCAENYALIMLGSAITYCTQLSRQQDNNEEEASTTLTADKLMFLSGSDLIKTAETIGQALSDSQSAREICAAFVSLYDSVPCEDERELNFLAAHPSLLIREIIHRACVRYLISLHDEIKKCLLNDSQLFKTYYGSDTDSLSGESGLFDIYERIQSGLRDTASKLASFSRQFPQLEIHLKKAAALNVLMQAIDDHALPPESAILSFADKFHECEVILKQPADAAYNLFYQALVSVDIAAKSRFEIAVNLEYIPEMLLSAENTDLKTLHAARSDCGPDGPRPASKPVYLMLCMLDIIMHEFHRGKGISGLITFTVSKMDEADQKKIHHVLNDSEVIDVDTLLKALVNSNLHDLELCEKLNAFAVLNQIPPPFNLGILIKILQRIEIYNQRAIEHLMNSDDETLNERDTFRMKTGTDKQSYLTELYAIIECALSGDRRALEKSVEEIKLLQLKASNREQYPDALTTYSRLSRSHITQLSYEALRFLGTMIEHPETYDTTVSQYQLYRYRDKPSKRPNSL